MLINFSVTKKGQEEPVEPPKSPPDTTRHQRKNSVGGGLLSFFMGIGGRGKDDSDQDGHNTTIDVSNCFWGDLIFTADTIGREALIEIAN